MSKYLITLLLTLVCVGCKNHPNSLDKISPKYDTSNVNSTWTDDVIIPKYTSEENIEFIKGFNETIIKFSNAPEPTNIANVNLQLKQLALEWEKNYGRLVESKIDSSYPDFIKKQHRAIEVLKKFQHVMFPKYRKVFADDAKEKLWIHDCEAKAVGTDNLTLVLSGNYFLPNIRKQNTYNELEPAIKKYRFKHLLFKWYMSENNGTYYNIGSKHDTDYLSISDY